MSTKVHKITFDHEKLEWDGITVKQVKMWEEAYPHVDVVDTILKKMPAWLSSNPEKAHKKQWARFINNWLSKQEDRYSQFRR